MRLCDLAHFHDDLRAAIALKVPISLEGDRITGLERIDQLETALNNCVSTNDSSQDYLETNSDTPSRYRVAVQTFSKSGSMLPVLDGLSVKIAASQEATSAIQWALTYVIVTIAVASAGLFWFAYSIVPTIYAIRDDLIQTRALQNVSTNQFLLIDWSASIAIAFAVLLLAVLVAVLVFGFRKACMWLGGREFVDAKAKSIALQNTYFMTESGIDVDQAAKLSCEMIGIENSKRDNILSLANSIESPKDLLNFSEHSSMVANQILNRLRVRIPVRMIVILGGLISLVYCVAIFWPIISLLNDLLSASYGR